MESQNMQLGWQTKKTLGFLRSITFPAWSEWLKLLQHKVSVLSLPLWLPASDVSYLIPVAKLVWRLAGVRTTSRLVCPGSWRPRSYNCNSLPPLPELYEWEHSSHAASSCQTLHSGDLYPISLFHWIIKLRVSHYIDSVFCLFPPKL